MKWVAIRLQSAVLEQGNIWNMQGSVTGYMQQDYVIKIQNRGTVFRRSYRKKEFIGLQMQSVEITNRITILKLKTDLC